MTPERKDLLERIRSMQAKAENDASTENEAMQSAAMAAKMMAKHEVTEAELDLLEGGAQGITKQRLNHGTKKMHHALKYAAHGIETLTETKGYVTTAVWGDQRLVFIGLDSDVEMALYLSLMIKGAADRAWKKHAKGMRFTNRERSRKSFLIGFGWRIKERLVELAHVRKASRSSGSTALVIRKDALIGEYIAKDGVEINESRSRKTTIDEHYDHGQSAGDGLNLSRPIEGDDAAEPVALT